MRIKLEIAFLWKDARDECSETPETSVLVKYQAVFASSPELTNQIPG
jgi:hypothetical protein